MTNMFKPLSEHTRLRYDECCAKLILEELFPERYEVLLVVDKPDLQGLDVGVEVTTANDPIVEEVRSNSIKAHYSNDEKIKNRYIERMARHGVAYTGGVQAFPGTKSSFALTQKAVENKIQKLKSGSYKVFRRYELFVFTDTWYHEYVIKDAKSYLFDKSVSEFFKTVYILSEGYDLHLFETEDKIHNNIKIDIKKQSERNIRARQMVEAVECK